MSRLISRKSRAIAFALAAASALALAGCGDDAESKAPLSTSALTKVTVTIGATINFAAPHVALDKGFWKAQGLDVDLAKQASGAPASLAGLISGDSVMAFTGGPSVVAPLSQGAPLKLAVNVGLGYSIELTAANDFMASRHLTAQSSLADRVRALKGAKLGYDVPGGSMDQFYRYLFKTYGVNPDKDLTMVALKSADVELAALRRGDIDVMAGSPPVGVTAEFEGAGKLYVRPTEVPGLNEYPYLIGSVSARGLQEHGDVIKALVKGLMLALDYIKANPDDARAIVRKGFTDMPEAAFDSAFKDVLAVMPPTPLITPESYKAMMDFEKGNGGDTTKFTYENTVAADVVNDALK